VVKPVYVIFHVANHPGFPFNFIIMLGAATYIS
jgi:hypothetical protein